MKASLLVIPILLLGAAADKQGVGKRVDKAKWKVTSVLRKGDSTQEPNVRRDRDALLPPGKR